MTSTLPNVESYELDDRFRRDHGRAFLSGSQALARLPFEQLRADRRAGLRTAAYVTGYPGSPLAGYDRDVTLAARLATADGLELRFQPAMNEELAATAVMGSQLAVNLSTCRYDGILGMWYGKAPGLDRASDALRHAVFAGASAKGGALALVGDDPNAKSSTLPSSSGPTLVDLHMPIIFPGDVQEAIDLGRHAIALSRASGVWAAIKIVESVADGTGSVELHPDRIQPVIPSLEVDGRPWVPTPSGRIVTPHTLQLERELIEVRLELARRYGVANRLNRVEVGGPDDWIGIAASGQTYHEVVEALRVIGLRTERDLRAAGVRLFKIGMPMPLDADEVRAFGRGLAEILVVEDKAPNLEWFVKDALYSTAERPLVSGKHDPDRQPLFPSVGTLDADTIAPLLRRRLASRLAERLTPEPPAPRQLIPLAVTRSPYFCSGCPHNTSTRVPDGSLVGAGIGCHTMVMLMESAHTGDIVGVTAMGNEGAQWFGIAPFVDDPHLIQNIGDGTLFHSGMTAIRAAIASGTNITYKILYNGAVSMTGGQDPTGQLDVPALCRVLRAEGVRRVIVTTDELSRYRDVDLPERVAVWGRERLIEAQQVLAAEAGCTVLVHDQRCAAEKRRDRKRGRIEAPPFKVVIDERVCEGCGDCGEKSNCLSVQPVDTPFGRKTRIDTGSCNFDLSCMDGDCPSFMTVVPGRSAQRSDRRRVPDAAPDVAAPAAAAIVDCTVRLAGIGGTGVVTVSQVLGTAAMLQGFHVRGLDQTGLSQKAGPVVSDVRLTAGAPSASNKATARSVDVLLAFDQLVAGAEPTLRTADPSSTVVVVNTATVPTGAMVTHPDRAYPAEQVADRLEAVAQRLVRVDAQRLVRALLGDDTTVNVFMLGIAVQAGLLPLDPEFVERAIDLNGVAVAKNQAAFRWGRAWSADASAVERAADPDRDQSVTPADRPLRERLADDLRGYQDARYSARFDAVVDEVAAAGHPALTDAVTRNLHKLMAYKDEYEVARLLLLPSSRAQVERVGGRGAKVTWHLHPPALRSMGMRRKLRLSAGGRTALRTLRAMRRLRGSALDPFGRSQVRRVERAMVPEYVDAIRALLPHVGPANLAEVIAIAELPDRVRGYEHLKMERATAYRAELARRVAAVTSG